MTTNVNTNILSDFKKAFMLLVVITFLTGFIYPLIITGIAQIFFPWRANGSLIEQHGKIIGSALIGQSFTDPKYFWGRPSATLPYPYNAKSSSGSNLGPTNPLLLQVISERVQSLKVAYLNNEVLIPIDLVTASGSGLDPEISPQAAFYQISRISKTRGILEKDIEALIQKLIKKRSFWLLGEPRINVLELNIALDNMRPLP